MTAPRLTLLACLLPAAACRTLESTANPIIDPIVVVHGARGDELGVSTEYGVVFLGRTVQTGRTEFTVWFGDGPAREEGLVESVGGGLFTTGSEILLPCVRLCFQPPPPGTPVIVRGRRAGLPYEIDAELAADPRVTGVLLQPSEELDALTDADIGAGVFLVESREPLQLVGILSGRLELDGRRRYVATVSGEDFWRLVVHQRNSERPRRWVYREDIL